MVLISHWPGVTGFVCRPLQEAYHAVVQKLQPGLTKMGFSHKHVTMVPVDATRPGDGVWTPCSAAPWYFLCAAEVHLLDPTLLTRACPSFAEPRRYTGPTLSAVLAGLKITSATLKLATAAPLFVTTRGYGMDMVAGYVAQGTIKVNQVLAFRGFEPNRTKDVPRTVLSIRRWGGTAKDDMTQAVAGDIVTICLYVSYERTHCLLLASLMRAFHTTVCCLIPPAGTPSPTAAIGQIWYLVVTWDSSFTALYCTAA